MGTEFSAYFTMDLVATADLLETGVVSLEVPAGLVGYSYRAADSLEAFVISGVQFVRFGYTGLFDSILLDIATGEVVESGRI